MNTKEKVEKVSAPVNAQVSIPADMQPVSRERFNKLWIERDMYMRQCNELLAAARRESEAYRICGELLSAAKIALGQLENSKPLSGVHASSLRSDIEIIRSAISNFDKQVATIASESQEKEQS